MMALANDGTGAGIGLKTISISLFVPSAKQAAICATASPLGQVLVSVAVAVTARGLLLQGLFLFLLGVASWIFGGPTEGAQ